MKKHLLIILGFALFFQTAQAQNTPYAQTNSVYVTPTSQGQFSGDLSVGDRGQDVIQLQTWLIEHGFNIPSVSSGAVQKGYFGTQTKVALAAYQSSVGLPPSGFFGPLTRSKMNSSGTSGYNTGGGVTYPGVSYPAVTYPQYQYPTQYTPIGGGVAPVINGIDAPTTLSVGQLGTWTVRATDSYNGTLSYYVDWGDNATLPSGYTGAVSNPAFSQSATFTHSYANAGTYTIRFTVRNGSGVTAQSSATVFVQGSVSNGALRVVSPNGGEVWQRGSVQSIVWTSPAYFHATYADLRLIPYLSCTGTTVCPAIAYAPYTIAQNISINQGSYSWYVGNATQYSGNSSLTVVPEGQYQIQVCESGTNNCDTSDSPFTIASTNTSYLPDINVVLPNGGERWTVGASQVVTVNITGDQYRVGNVVTAYLVDSYNRQTLLQTYTTISTPPSTGVKTFYVNVPFTTTPGSYRLLVNLYAQSVGNSIPVQQAYDYSDSYITVVGNGINCPLGYTCN